MKTHTANWKSNGVFAITTVVIVLIVLTVIPANPDPLTLDDLEHVRMGLSYEKIAGEIGGGDWLSDAEFFTVAYEVEGEMQLVMVFEDSIHLSAVTLHRPDGTTVTIGNTHQTNKEQFSIFSSASSALGQ